jgi:hypothetical protein
MSFLTLREAFSFAVADNGTGIEAEELARLFDPFVRGTAAMVSGEPGTGLGLPLVKRIAEHLHGLVTACSQPGRGICFTVTLPRFAFTAGPEPSLVPDPQVSFDAGPAPSSTARPALLVLITEDHAPNAAILAEICELEGPGAILRIKEDPRTASIRIIALTAYAQLQDAAHMADVGAVAYLTKPINFDRLLKLFGHLGLLPSHAPKPGGAIDT